ncbi:MAG TPA: CHASE domain-containing protein, partial [Qipengyuania sp.]|nr:CHASE domain-containing protein [Qipengyuania sp.]
LLVEHQRAAPVIIFLLILAITAIGVISIERGERAREQSQMGRVALAAASALERRASINASYLRAGAALFALQPDIDEPLFQRFVAELRLDTDYRGAEGIGWAPVLRVGADSAIPQEGFARDALPLNLRPSLAEQPRAVVVPVTYLLPETVRNRRAVGFDMYSEPVRRAAMVEAERRVRPTASGKVVLVQEGRGGSPGFLIYMPVFDQGAGSRQLRGFIYSPYNAGDFLASARELVDLQGMRLVLYDGEPSEANLLGMIAGTGDGEGMQVRQELRLANRPMILEVTSLSTASLSAISMVVLLFGLAVASLLMLVARLLTKQMLEDQRALAWFAEQNSIRNSLTRELNHRVKNTLANVLSIVTLTRRRSKTLDEFADGLDGRIRALSATHDLLTQSDWGTTPIGAVVAAELAPYTRAEDDALEMSGPPVELAPNDALSLGLALHELATNASKYGALSVTGGRVSVQWSLIEDNLARIDWVESGGPRVPAKRPRGFGTDLIEKIVAHELRNPVDLTFAPEGVRCTLKVPVRQPIDFVMRTTPRRILGH